MKSIGIDLGGTKIETQIFDDDWTIAHRHRVDTPKTYADFVTVLLDQIRWARGYGADLPVGIGAAGLIDHDGLSLTANLPATGHPLAQTIFDAAGGTVLYLNDCRTFTLSEAIFGAGRGYGCVLGLILGTGVGAGIAVNGSLLSDPMALGGEIGHTAAPANLIVDHNLGVLPCGCGRRGCYESYCSGPGLTRVIHAITGRTLTPQQIAELRQSDTQIAQAWGVWTEIVAELIIASVFHVDPDAIVIGGGLSKIDGLTTDLAAAYNRRQLRGFKQPAFIIAQGGDASGARGAAYAAWSKDQNRAGD